MKIPAGFDDYLNQNPVVNGTIPPSSMKMQPLPPDGQVLQLEPGSADPLDYAIPSNSHKAARYFQQLRRAPGEIRRFVFERIALDLDGNADLRHVSTQYRQALDLIDLSEYFLEDLVVYYYDPRQHRGYVETALVRHPNLWSARQVINRGFADIHGSTVRGNPDTFAAALTRKPHQTMTRVGAISFCHAPILKRLPEFPNAERFFDPENPSLFMRFERQTLTTFPLLRRFLFTIRTYFVDCTAPEYRENFAQAIESANPEAVYNSTYWRADQKTIPQWLRSLD